MSLEHGDVTITLKGNIIIVRTSGAFNEFGAKQYTEGLKKMIKGLEGKPFSILVNNLDFLGGTPEAYQELESYNLWLNKQKLIAKAMVITSGITIELIDKHSPARATQQTQNFNDEASAMKWLVSLS